MKIVDPSFVILHELDEQSLAVRIEYSGRICYKSEDRIDQDSAIPFVRKMAEYGHNSVLEMGVVTHRVRGAARQQITSFFLCNPKYLQIDFESKETLLVTGSLRAYRELYQAHPDNDIISALMASLSARHPYFFETILADHAPSVADGLIVEKVELAEVAQLGPFLRGRHRYLAIKFIVNRAVTHELVRHRPCSFLQESQRYCRYSADKFGNEVTFIKPLFYDEGSIEFLEWKKAMEETEKIYFKLLESSTPQAARTVLPNSCKTEIIVYANFVEWQHILSLRTPKEADPSMREVMIPLQEKLSDLYPGFF